jgi:hypothetical protein
VPFGWAICVLRFAFIGRGGDCLRSAYTSVEAPIVGAKGALTVVQRSRSDPQRLRHTIGDSAGAALANFTTRDLMVGTHPHPGAEVLLRGEGGFEIGATLRENGLESHGADTVDLGKVHASNAHQFGTHVELGRVLARARGPSFAALFLRGFRDRRFLRRCGRFSILDRGHACLKLLVALGDLLLEEVVTGRAGSQYIIAPTAGRTEFRGRSRRGALWPTDADRTGVVRANCS